MALSLPRRPRRSGGSDANQSKNSFGDPMGPDDFTPISPSDIGPGESVSVVNGIEVASMIAARTRTRRDGLGRDGSLNGHRDAGALQAKDRVWEGIANKLLPPEESELMIQRLEKKADSRQRRTYIEGVASSELQENVPVLMVGLTFLRGADKPQVNRSEQNDMMGGGPDQRDATWRLNTAGSLLLQIDVTQDLQVVHSDQTAAVLEKSRQRLRKGESLFAEMASRSQALSLRGKVYDAVNIDSECVKIVNDLRAGEWDLESTLIEIDGSSLNSLICNYRSLIASGGPEMTFERTKNLLETMIEDARRVCIRSPILFRMSTRAKIINSKNTRYGIDHGVMFRTLTTSKGIREIIQLSASYYDSLDPAGSKDDTQKFIKPKFLQMLVLLLSFLNDEDLREIKDFLESTYEIKADRQHLELLFLKVIPLISINSKIFIRSLIPAFEGFPLTEECGDYEECWDYFVQRLLAVGYILPGTVTDLGRAQSSWIVKWPEQGFKSSIVFRALQYAGCPLRAINDIPPIELHPEASLEELIVILTNGEKYIIGSEDLERITCLLPGIYSVIETGQDGKNFDLDIQEYVINEELYEAIRRMNDIIRQWNHALTAPSKSRALSFPFRGPKWKDIEFLNDIKGSGRLTKNAAMLNQDLLALAFKIEGKKVTRNDLIRNMARDIRELRGAVNYLETRTSIMDARIFSRSSELRLALTEVKNLITMAESNKRRVGEEIKINDEPIEKVVYPGTSAPRDSNTWSDYSAWYTNSDGRFHIEAKQSVVSRVSWLRDDQIEVSLEHLPSKFILAPLQPVEEGARNDEIQRGDIAILAGDYMIVAVPSEVQTPRSMFPDYIMTNYLKVLSAEEQNFTRRGMNRIKRPETKIQCVIR